MQFNDRSPRSMFTVMRVDHPKQIVFIIDDCRPGTLSVTNDAERVVAVLHKQYPNYRVIYQDTQWEWDEIEHKAGVFVGFRPTPQRNLMWGGL